MKKKGANITEKHFGNDFKKGQLNFEGEGGKKGLTRKEAAELRRLVGSKTKNELKELN